MKEGHLDRIFNKLSKRVDRLTGNLVLEMKGQKPPFRDRIPSYMTIWAKDHLGTKDLPALIDEFGYENVDYQFYKIDKSRMDGRRR
jgi:hypothetical protein